MMVKPLKLIELDMSRAEGNTHPDVIVGEWYLVKIGSQYWAGRFNKVWFGLNFRPWANPVGIQFDAPGTNSSEWKGIWKLVEEVSESMTEEEVEGWDESIKEDISGGALKTLIKGLGVKIKED